MQLASVNAHSQWMRTSVAPAQPSSKGLLVSLILWKRREAELEGSVVSIFGALLTVKSVRHHKRALLEDLLQPLSLFFTYHAFKMRCRSI